MNEGGLPIAGWRILRDGPTGRPSPARGGRSGDRDRAGAHTAVLRPGSHGANIMVLSYGRSRGELLFDPALHFDDVNAAINNSTLLYGGTFGLFGRSGNVAVGVPYVWGEIEGFVEGEFRQITLSSLGDVRAQLTLNVLGGPALEIGKIMSGGCVPVLIFSACTRERSMPSVLEHSKSPRAVEATCG